MVLGHRRSVVPKVADSSCVELMFLCMTRNISVLADRQVPATLTTSAKTRLDSSFHPLSEGKMGTAQSGPITHSQILSRISCGKVPNRLSRYFLGGPDSRGGLVYQTA